MRRGDNGNNKKSFDRVGSKYIYSEYEVKGVNLSSLLNRARKEGILVKNVKFSKEKTLTLWVKVKDEKKFFAITKNLCYNVKRIRNCGKLLFLINLLNSPSIIMGAVIFTLLTIYFSGLILGFSFTGSGKRYSEEVVSLLSERGVKKGVFIFNENLESLSNEIIKSSDKFSFVSLKKKGNRLVVELVLSENKPYIKGEVKDLLSTESGVIEDIKVYRGTAMVSVGDSVEKGDLLILGQMQVKEKLLEVNALGIVTIKVSREFNYILDSDNDEEKAIAFALSSLDEEAESVSVDKSEKNGKYYYKVKAYYKRIIYTG